MTSQPATPPAPSGAARVGGYDLLSRIGEGGMGVVHLARRPGGPRVALKVLRPHIVGDDEARRRLAREVSSLSLVRSRWVAEIVDADPWAPIPYVATRYVPGLSLHDHVVEEGPVTGHDLLWLAACLAEGLASIHEVGVLHRDVKPSNVLMEGRTPIVIDFGLARVADDPKLTHTGWLLGTPGYLAPEILYGDDATTASDVHSWAATVAYAATGRAVFGRGPSMAIMDRVRRGEHDLSGLDGPLRQVVAAALDPEPSRRPTLDVVLDWLRPQTTRPTPLLVAPPEVGDPAAPPVEDVFTLPLALAALGAVEAPTVVAPSGPAGVGPAAVGAPATRVLTDGAAPTRREGVDPTWRAPAPYDAAPYDAAPAWLAPEPGAVERVSAGERARRAVLVLAGCVAVGAAVAAAPWPVLAVLLAVVWLLRSGSLAAAAVGARRRVRGRRWYDGPQFLLRAPWHLVQSVPGTALLVLWSLGLAAAAALVCYAVAAGTSTTLFAGGVVLAGSLWWGPGGSRVRSPLGRLVAPASRTAGWWLLAVVGLLLLAAALGVLVASQGTSWTPGGRQPFASSVSFG